jgi:hypothetical protein
MPIPTQRASRYNRPSRDAVVTRTTRHPAHAKRAAGTNWNCGRWQLCVTHWPICEVEARNRGVTLGTVDLCPRRLPCSMRILKPRAWPWKPRFSTISADPVAFAVPPGAARCSKSTRAPLSTTNGKAHFRPQSSWRGMLPESGCKAMLNGNLGDSSLHWRRR